MAARPLRALAQTGTWAKHAAMRYAEPMTGALFTIGYEGRTHVEYLALLRDAAVTLLAGVRRNPISCKKGFSKSTRAEG